MFLAYSFAHLMAAYLNVIIAIIMQVKHTVNFTVHTNMDVVDAFDTFADRLTGVFLHLNVVKFPARKKSKKLKKRKKFKS